MRRGGGEGERGGGGGANHSKHIIFDRKIGCYTGRLTGVANFN